MTRFNLVTARFGGRAHAPQHRARSYATKLLRAGWPPEDVAAALSIEGAAVAIEVFGTEAAADYLRRLADHAEAADGA